MATEDGSVSDENVSLPKNGSAMDWEERYLAGDTPWEKGQAHPALVAWLERNTLPGRILVPGCGSGHDVRALAAHLAEVTGLDVAPSAVAAAQQVPCVARETYLVGDFFHLPASWSGAFDGLFEHTCFCAINPADRSAYVESAAAVLRPGGLFLGIFYLDPGHDEDGPPHGCTKAELDALFSPDFALVSEETASPTHPGREGRELLRVLRRRTAPEAR